MEAGVLPAHSAIDGPLSWLVRGTGPRCGSRPLLIAWQADSRFQWINRASMPPVPKGGSRSVRQR